MSFNELTKSSDTDKKELARCLIDDVKEVFSTMVGFDDILHLPMQIDPVTNFNGSVSALVGLAGAHSGLISLHMPGDLAIKATSSMLDTDVAELNDDVHDALGEIANMIAGSFKMHLSNSGVDTRLSTPSVINGENYVITLGNDPDQIALRFGSDDYWFMVAVALENNTI